MRGQRGADPVERPHQDAVAVEPDAAVARQQIGARVIRPVRRLQRIEIDVAIVLAKRLERGAIEQADVAAMPHDRLATA